MQKGIIGKKLGMTQLFDEKGNVIPVTVIEAGPCVVAQKKTAENDGYEAVQIGFGDMKASKVKKPAKGHFAKGDVAPKKVLREFRLEDTSALNVGDIIKADVFAEGDCVDVRVLQRVRDMPAQSNAGTSQDLKNLTVQVRFTVTADRSVHAQARQEFSRARKWRVTSVTSALRFRTSA